MRDANKPASPEDAEPVAEPAGLLVIDIDANGRCSGGFAGSLALLRNLGAARTPRATDHLPSLLSPEFARALKHALAECGCRNHTVVRVVPANGTDARVFIELSVVARLSEGTDGPAMYCVTIREATAGITQMRTLNRLARIAATTSNLVVVTDARRRIEWVNDSFTHVSGYTLDEAKGRRPGELLQFSGTDTATVERIRRALDAQQPVKATILNRAKSGREYWLHLDIQPVLDERGQLDGFLAVQSDITEERLNSLQLARLARQAELAHSTLQAAVAGLPSGFALFDAEDRLVFCNEPYRLLHPRAITSLRPGTTLEAIFREEVAQGEYPICQGRPEQWLAEVLDALRVGTEWSQEIALADGRWVRSVKRRIATGGRIALRSDITSLKQAERSAILQRAAAMDASHDGIAITDTAGRLVYVNPALLRASGHACADHWIGRAWESLFHPDDRVSLTAASGSALAASGLWRGTLRSRSSAAGQAPDNEVALTRAPDGSLVLISRDISDRLRLEAEKNRLHDLVVFERVAHEARLERALIETRRLHERDRQLREDSELLLGALQSLSAAESLANGPLHLLGQLGEALKTRCVALVASEGEEPPLCLDEPAWWIEFGKHTGVVEYLMAKPRRLIRDLAALPPHLAFEPRWPRGKLRWMLSARLQPFRSSHLLVICGSEGSEADQSKTRLFSRFIPLVGEALRRRDDHLRARKLERDLLQAHKMEALGTLAGGIAHEINTPMQFISDNLHFLRDAFRDLMSALPSKRSEATANDTPDLAYIQQEIPLAIEQSIAGSRRVAELVEAVRTFAYPELARVERIQLRDMLEHCLVITRTAWKHDLAVSLECADDVPAVTGSAGQISQVFINLTTNACDAARMASGGSGGIVRLSLDVSGDCVVVHVDDNGPGVPAALRDRIFDPFFTTKGVGKGTGQGLGISRSIVERHGGRIRLADSPLGGARFSVTLPLACKGEADAWTRPPDASGIDAGARGAAG